MRKTLALVLSALMLVSLLSVSAFAAEGTAINTAAEFLAMDPAGTYYLNADITLDTRYGYVDDSTTTPFTGTLDGNGHTITTSVCIFETLNGATIKNLTINGAVVIANGGTTGSGVLARNSKSAGATLINITNNASLTIEVIEGNAYVGTLIGAVSKGTLTVTNCTNNGKITAKTAFNYNGTTAVAPRFGGLTGNVAKDVVPTFTGCVNNGDIELFDTSVDGDGNPIVSTGATYLGGISSDCFCGTFDHCTNNGNLSSNVPLDGAGICGRTPPSKQLDNHSVTYTYCVNNGNITTSAKSSRAIGGIQGYAGASGVKAVYTIDHCLNTGKISYTGPATGNIGGLAGYVYASGSSETVVCINSINTGDVSAAGPAFVSEFVGYSNSASNTIANNIGLGKLTAGAKTVITGGEDTDGNGKIEDNGTDIVEKKDFNLTVLIGVSSANANPELIQNNFVLDTAGLNFYSFASDYANVDRRIAVADAPEGSIIFVTDAQVKSGEVAFLANQAAGENVFFQNIDKGTKDAAPVLDNTHGTVYKLSNGYSNSAEEPTAAPTEAPTAAPTAAPTEAPTAAPTEAPTAAPTEAPTAAPTEPVTEPENPFTGDSFAIYAVIAVVAVLGTAVVIRKKVSD